MQGPAHLVFSWFTAESCGFRQPRSRRIIALAGLSPDFDALAYIVAYVWFGFDRNRAYEEVWIKVHHYYTHGIGFAVFVGVLAWLWARSGGKTQGGWDAPVYVALFSGLVVLLHVFFDVIAAGPRFPVYPFWPLSDMSWTVSWSWELVDWPNQIITLCSLVAIIIYARVAGYSPLESLNYKLDKWVVKVAQQGSDESVQAGGEEKKVWGMDSSTALRVVVYSVLLVVSLVLILPVAEDIFL